MAPNIFSKFFKRKKEPEPPRRFNLKEWSPLAIGISGSTCEVNGDIFNRWKLPIPSPEQRARKIGTRKRNSQERSIFFRVPVEIRRLIYIELMGGRRVHIRHVWKEPSPFRPQPIQGGARWNWWHCVCDKSNSFPEDPDFDHCRDWEDEAWLNERNPKIHGVEWLRSCQIGYEEALEILYKTNVFAMDKALDTPFLMSRLMSPRCASYITSMDISFPVSVVGTGYNGRAYRGYNENDWKSTYTAFFDLIGETFHGVRRLRLQLKMPPYPWEFFCGDSEEQWMDILLGPFDRLSKGREWTQLQLCVPYTWREHFEKFKEPMPCQAKWELTETIWSDPSGQPVCGAMG